jgi:hypothetical protein
MKLIGGLLRAHTKENHLCSDLTCERCTRFAAEFSWADQEPQNASVIYAREKRSVASYGNSSVNVKINQSLSYAYELFIWRMLAFS